MGAPFFSPAEASRAPAERQRWLRAVESPGATSPPETPPPETPPRETPRSAAPRKAARPESESSPLTPLDTRRVAAIAVFAFEAVEGARQVEHLGRWVSEQVAARLTELRALNSERRSLHRDSRRIVPSVRRVRLTQPHPWALEAAVVLTTPTRSRAVALRFEPFRERWQATDITVL